jgi:hypothetical protein
MVTQAQAPCRYCNQPRRPEMLSEISRESPLIDRKLQELGIPDFDIIRFRNEDARCYVCLKGDSSLGWREPAAGRRRIGQRNDT